MIDQNLSFALFSTISPSILPFIVNLDTSADIWSWLNRRYQATSLSRIIMLRNQLRFISMKDDSMDLYLSEIKSIVDQLAAVGSMVQQDDIVLYTLNGLPDCYQGFKKDILGRLEPIQLEELHSLLLTWEQHINSNVVCQICGKFGHSAMVCWHRMDSEYPIQGSNNPQIEYNDDLGSHSSDEWFFDSGGNLTHANDYW